MRKAFTTRFYLLLLGSIGIISFTFFFASRSYNEACKDTVECTQTPPADKLNNGGALLWESLSQQFVVSVIPE